MPSGAEVPGWGVGGKEQFDLLEIEVARSNTQILTRQNR